MAQLQSLLKPHMLRRMKKDVPDLDIPDKRELVVPIELSREQKEVYRAILTKNMDVLRKVRGVLVVRCLPAAQNRMLIRYSKRPEFLHFFFARRGFCPPPLPPAQQLAMSMLPW